MSSIAQILESIVGAEAICDWQKLDPGLRSQIQQAVDANAAIDCVVYPQTPTELEAVIAEAFRQKWRVLLCGNGSKLHWGGLAQGIQFVVSTARLNRLIEHAVGDLTVTAESGMKLADLQAILAKAGQFLPIDPSYADTATLGGIVATADTGALRQRYGGIRDLLIGISIIRTDGKRSKAGGRVVKNVAGYDLMKLFTGSYGTLGAIEQVTFRVYPLAAASRSVVLVGATTEIAQATAAVLASGLTPTAIELLAPPTVSALSHSGLDLGQGVGLLVRFQSMEVSVEKQAAQVLQVGQALGLHNTLWQDEDEAQLWQQLREHMEVRPQEPQITCKIGVAPSSAATMLDQFSQLAPALTTAVIHAGSGLGTVKVPATLSTSVLYQLRQRCQEEGGFLSVLEAPIALKQKFEVWGYAGNALEPMQTLKQHFDPANLFSPHRFVGGI